MSMMESFDNTCPLDEDTRPLEFDAECIVPSGVKPGFTYLPQICLPTLLTTVTFN